MHQNELLRSIGAYTPQPSSLLPNDHPCVFCVGRICGFRFAKMDVFSSLGGPAVSRQSLFNLSHFSLPQKRHISNIYASLTVNVLLTAIGVYIQLYVLALPPLLSFILSIGCVLGLSFSSQKANFEGKMLTKERCAYFGGFGLLNGMLIANYLHAVHFYVGPQIIPTAFLASVAVFCCLSACALVATQRSYLYLGSLLSGALMYFSLASLLNILLKIKFLNDVLLWAGLLMYIGFVVYDTQLAVAQFDGGNRDFLLHALQFYINFLSIFMRLVAILSERQEEGNRRRRNDKQN